MTGTEGRRLDNATATRAGSGRRAAVLLVSAGLTALLTGAWVDVVPAPTAVAATAPTAVVATAPVPTAVVATTPAPGRVRAPVRPHPHRKPWPITLTVQTSPVLAGIRIGFDGRVARTDAAGRASFTQQHNFLPHTLRLVDTSRVTPQRRFRFVRWAGQRDPDQAFRPSVSGLPMRTNYTVTAAFSVQFPVSAAFVDPQGLPVSPAGISSVRIRTAAGTLLGIPSAGTIWLDGQVPMYRDSTIQTAITSYSLYSVIVGGTNVVDAGRQRFEPARDRRPKFTTKFFDLTVRAHDLLFGNAAGTAASVVFPDGSRHVLDFGRARVVALTHLPRGTYTVDVAHGGGTTIPRQFVLSRSTDVDLAVATPPDYALIGAIGLMATVGLVLVGRARARMVRAVQGLSARGRGDQAR